MRLDLMRLDEASVKGRHVQRSPCPLSVETNSSKIYSGHKSNSSTGWRVLHLCSFQATGVSLRFHNLCCKLCLFFVGSRLISCDSQAAALLANSPRSSTNLRKLSAAGEGKARKNCSHLSEDSEVLEPNAVQLQTVKNVDTKSH